jgi:CheY-like chemotaxis protein
MFQTEWPVLLVDDDPDVLAVSKLAMKSFEIDGVPIRLFTATSKEEAVKLLSGPLGTTALPYISVAFIDVVMETDHAGLDLCRYIRETQMNRITTIYVRTGQPGIAPERDVIDATTSTAISPRSRRPRTSSTRWSRRASGSSTSPA